MKKRKIDHLLFQPPLIVGALALLFLPKSGWSQGGTPALSYGQMAFKDDFLNQLRTIDAYDFGQPVQLLGIASNGDYLINRGEAKTCGHFMWEQIIPQKFQVNDSVSGKLSGMLFGCGVGWDLFPKNERFDFICNAGIQIGRLKVRQSNFRQYKSTNNNLHLKNMFISPKLTAIVKVNFDNFGLFAQVDYAYDVSDPRWKEKLLAIDKPASVALPDFRQTGLLLHIGIVLPIRWFSQSETGMDDQFEDDINY